MGKIEREIYIITNYNWDSSCPDIVSSYESLIKYFQEVQEDYDLQVIPDDISLDDLDKLIGDEGFSVYKQSVTFYED